MAPCADHYWLLDMRVSCAGFVRTLSLPVCCCCCRLLLGCSPSNCAIVTHQLSWGAHPGQNSSPLWLHDPSLQVGSMRQVKHSLTQLECWSMCCSGMLLMSQGNAYLLISVLPRMAYFQALATAAAAFQRQMCNAFVININAVVCGEI